ncbi:MiaB/RimO family radical SAM methylthiotransferase [Candidatus Omnitrophota bacterium]
MKKIKLSTLGCKVNQYDTQSIRERFLGKGYQEIFNGNGADICLINTCTVTAAADAKSRNLVRNAIKENPFARIIVTGCMVKETTEPLLNIRGIDYIIPKSFFNDGITGFSGHTRAFLKIQDGCNNFCSYCKVPLVRGRSQSRALSGIVCEAQKLVKNGYREIVLCGICLGAYGRDLKPKKNLVAALRELEKIKGLLRIRLSSIEAGDVSQELIDAIADSQKICRHLHIPIQSGADIILKKMNRRYSRKKYSRLVKHIKRSIPGAAITTDVLVGFPGESEAHFNNTIDLVKEIEPLRVHVFPYSARTGTLASKLSGAVSPDVVKKRVRCAKNLAEQCSRSFRKKFLGKSEAVLFENRVNGSDSSWQGYTDNYIKVRMRSSANLENIIRRVRLDEALLALA